MLQETFDATVEALLNYPRSVVVPGIMTLLCALPFLALIGIGWGHFFAVKGERRSWRGAARQVFPLSDYRTASSRSDVGNFVLQLLVVAPVLGIFSRLLGAIVSAEIIKSLLVQALGLSMVPVSNPAVIIVVQATVFILATDFGEFIGHYLSHRVPFLWSLHRAHHSAESLVIFTINRVHPLGALFTQGIIRQLIVGVVVGPVLYLMNCSADPVAIAVLGYFYAVQPLRVMLQHRRIRMSFGWLNHLFMAPVLHQVHHSAELRHRDKNMGANFAIWDWMFGTLYLPDKQETWRVGLNEEEIGKTNPHIRVQDFYLEPMRHMIATCFMRGARRTAQL